MDRMQRFPDKKPVRTRMNILARMAYEQDSTDVLGMYTGTGRDDDEPVQDQDDL